MSKLYAIHYRHTNPLSKFNAAILIILAATLCLTANMVFAVNRQPKIVLPPITVTSKYQGNRGAAFESSTAPKNIITIEQSELERSIQRSVTETLRGRLGVLVNVASEGRETFMQLQGITAGQNAITFDGVPLLSTVPGLNWLDAMPPEAIGHISVTTQVQIIHFIVYKD